MTPRAKLAKRITTKKPEPEKPAQATNERGVPYWEVYELETGHVVHTFLSDDLPDAVTDAYNWLTSIGAEQPDLFKVRPKMNAGTPVKDIAPDVAQNFGDDPIAAYERNSDRINAIRAGQNATDRVGSWSIYDVTLGREISRMNDVAWSQADARANELERSTGHNISVRGLSENINESAGQYVTRIDSSEIKDFDSNMPTYYHTKDWSQSGQFAPGSKIPKKFSGKVQGTFAGDPHRTALYATGNAGETRFVEITDLKGQSYVYFDQKDLPKIRARKTYLTVFPADNFKATNPNTGEYFSSNPGKPVKQEPITDPFQYITSQGWIVRTTDDLNKVLAQAKQLHKQNKIKSYGGEGMGVQENFADGRGPGRPGDSVRHGIPKGATIAELERASHASGRKGQLARWQLNMRRGKKK